jgi:hypothetical protein
VIGGRKTTGLYRKDGRVALETRENEMEKTTKILAILMLGSFLLTGVAFAVPVTVNYSTDNALLLFKTFEAPSLDWDSIDPLGDNASNWRIADSNTFDVEAGSFISLMFIAENNDEPVGAGNPGGFIAEINIGTYTFLTDDEWDVAEGDFFGIYGNVQPVKTDFVGATTYGSNVDESNAWTYVSGISDDAQWIWTEEPNVGVGETQYVSLNRNICLSDYSVPEPATMLLLGIGLIGLAATGRKKFIKK